MDLELSDEQRELRQAAAGTLDRHAPLALARSFLDGRGDARELWSQVADLGWYGVGIAGDGDRDPFGVPGLCLLAEQIGRRAAPTTLVDAALVARVAQAAGSEWAARVASGDRSVSLAQLEADSSWLASGPATSARRSSDGIVLDGEKIGVHHAGSVSLLAVVAQHDHGPALALVDPGRRGVSVTPVAGLDPASDPAIVRFAGVEIDDDEIVSGAGLAYAFDVAAVAGTAEGLGAAAAALKLAIAYALERVQYGRPIGAFQALQHIVADAHQQRETAWAAVLYAAAALEERTADAHAATLVAKAHGAASTVAVVEAALQVFGGVGVTREHDLHLLYRRALACADRFGGASDYEALIADALTSPEPALAGF